jgi:hypothetical protein
VWVWYWPVLGGYPVWRVKINGSGSGSCNLDSSWRQLVGTRTRSEPWKKCFCYICNQNRNHEIFF